MPAWTKDPALAAIRDDLRARIAAFDGDHFDAEGKRLCAKLLDAWLHRDPDGARRGTPAVAAAGIVHAFAETNDLPLTARRIAEGFGTSPAAVGARSRAIRRTLDDAGVDPAGFFTRDNRRRAEPLDDVTLAMDALLRDFPAGRRAPEGAFVDSMRPALWGYLDLMDRCRGRVDAAVRKELRALIALDPDFYDSYLTLADALGGAAGRRLIARAAARARARIPADTPIDPTFLENRHILRARDAEEKLRRDSPDV